MPPFHTFPGPLGALPCHQVVILSEFWTTDSLFYFTTQTLWFFNYPAGECTLFTYCSWKYARFYFLLLRCPKKPISVIVAPLGHERRLIWQTLPVHPIPTHTYIGNTCAHACTHMSTSCSICRKDIENWGALSSVTKFWIQPQPHNSSPSSAQQQTSLLPSSVLEVSQVLQTWLTTTAVN